MSQPGRNRRNSKHYTLASLEEVLSDAVEESCAPTANGIYCPLEGHVMHCSACYNSETCEEAKHSYQNSAHKCLRQAKCTTWRRARSYCGRSSAVSRHYGVRSPKALCVETRNRCARSVFASTRQPKRIMLHVIVDKAGQTDIEEALRCSLSLKRTATSERIQVYPFVLQQYDHLFSQFVHFQHRYTKAANGSSRLHIRVPFKKYKSEICVRAPKV